MAIPNGGLITETNRQYYAGAQQQYIAVAGAGISKSAEGQGGLEEQQSKEALCEVVRGDIEKLLRDIALLLLTPKR